MTIPPVVFSLITLGLVCWVYAYKFVRKLRHDDPEHGYTPFLVVGGNLMVMASFFVSVWLMFGINAAVIMTGLLFLHFAIAGLPMVAEYMEDHTNHRKSNGQIANLLGRLDGGNDDA